MPGYDGTGPQGMGPMTGGARGYCNPGAAGYGRGLRRGFRAGGTLPAYPPVYPHGGTSEVSALKARAAVVKNTLDEINRRIAELDKTSE